jgi:hypothetical protein
MIALHIGKLAVAVTANRDDFIAELASGDMMQLQIPRVGLAAEAASCIIPAE